MTVELVTGGMVSYASDGDVVQVAVTKVSAFVDGYELQANLDAYLLSAEIVDEKVVVGETVDIQVDAEIIDHSGTAER